jgi:hypothetical protein
MAAGDVVVTGEATLPNGLRLIMGTVVLDGANPTPVLLSAYVATILWGLATMDGSVAPGADPNEITSNVSGTTLNVYAWKVTTGGAAGNPTPVASSDNARLVNWIIIGTPKPAQTT